MSTSTPIEIVRAQNDWWLTHNSFMPPHTRSEYAAAIASVLADAERFQALERALWIRIKVTRGDRSFTGRRPGASNEFSCESLAELADTLKRVSQ